MRIEHSSKINRQLRVNTISFNYGFRNYVALPNNIFFPTNNDTIKYLLVVIHCLTLLQTLSLQIAVGDSEGTLQCFGLKKGEVQVGQNKQ